MTDNAQDGCPESERLVNMLCRDAFAKGCRPPFTITTASTKGTVHTIIVSRDGLARHTVQRLDPHQLSEDLRAGHMVVVQG